VGAQISLPAQHDAFVQLFSESTGRVLVSVRQGQERAFVGLAKERGVACVGLGRVQPAPGALVRDDVRPAAGRAPRGPHRNLPRPVRLTRSLLSTATIMAESAWLEIH
jgi:hypothetical protein